MYKNLEIIFRIFSHLKSLKRKDFKRKNGGAMRDRTADLLNANQALSQLSYSPIFRCQKCDF